MGLVSVSGFILLVYPFSSILNYYTALYMTAPCNQNVIILPRARIVKLMFCCFLDVLLLLKYSFLFLYSFSVMLN